MKSSSVERQAGKNTDWIIYGVAGVVTYIFLLFFCLHLGYAKKHPAYNLYRKEPSFFEIFGNAADSFRAHPFTGCWPLAGESVSYILIMTLIFGLLAVVLWSYIYLNRSDRAGEESGSAKWYKNFNKFHKDYADPVGEKGYAGERNIILADNLFMSFDGFLTQRNINEMVVGGSGTGKSRFKVKPNMLNHNTSYVITDPSGELLETIGKTMINMGHKVKILNLVDMEESFNYNPFDYIERENQTRKELDIAKIVDTLMENTVDPKAQKGEAFWDDSMKALYTAIIHLLIDFKDKEDQNFATVLKYINNGRVNDERGNAADTGLGKIFADCQKVEEEEIQAGIRKTASKAFTNFDTFKLAGGKTMQSILISASVRINKFSNDAVAKITRTNFENPEMNIHLERIGDEPTAMFVIIPTADISFNFIVSMFYSQMFEVLYNRAETICPKKFHIIDNKNFAIESMFKNKEAAQQRLEALKKAQIDTYERIERPRTDDNDGCVPEYNYNDIKKGKVKKNKKQYNRRKIYSVKIPFEEKTPEEIEKMTYVQKVEYTRMKEEGGEVVREFSEEFMAEDFLTRIANAEVQKGRKQLAWPVRFLLDEFANIGTIPLFNERLATMRKYNISCMVILQNLAQLKSRYQDDASSILGNCDIFTFLGSSELETCKQVSETLGDTTNRTKNMSYSGGKHGNYSSSYQQSARKLLDPAELTKLPNRLSIIRLRGLDPILKRKYRYERHPFYYMTGDADSYNNEFDEDFKKIYFEKKFKPVSEKKEFKEGTITETKDAKQILFKFGIANTMNIDSIIVATPDLMEEVEAADDMDENIERAVTYDAASIQDMLDAKSAMANQMSSMVQNFNNFSIGG